jgi:ABC-2 type transport system permease protein
MTAATPPAPIAGATSPGGSIYDLGYQGYSGPRLGRRGAISALFRHTLRSAYGLGRSGRAKAAPFILGAIQLLPAVIGVAIFIVAARAGQLEEAISEASPITYGVYHNITATIVILFCAAQAPELMGRDQRYGVMPLYFSRPLARVDYAFAKAAGLASALLILVLLPQLVMFVGRVLIAENPLDGLATELPFVPPILAQGVLTAGVLGSLSALIAAHTPRRAYATVTIVAMSIIPPGIVTTLLAMDLDIPQDLLMMLSPTFVLDGTNGFLFDTSPEFGFEIFDFGPEFVIAALVWIGVSLAFLARRYLRMTL